MNHACWTLACIFLSPKFAGSSTLPETISSSSPPAASQLWRVGKTPTIADVGPACGGVVQHDRFVKLRHSQRRATVSCYLREISKRLNWKLPSRSDYSTILERTNVVGTMLTYSFRADVYLSEIKPGAMAEWKPIVREEICADSVMKESITRGGTYRYLWRDRSGKYIDALIVRHCSD